MGRTVDYLLAAFVSEEMEEHPTAATRLGLAGHDDRLGEFTAGDFARRGAGEERWLARMAGLDDAELGPDERIDRDLVVAALRGRRTMRSWEPWRRDPNLYLGPCLSGVHSLFLHPSGPEGGRVAAAEARLRAVPGVLAAARANLEPELASPVFVERARGACRAGVAYTRSMVADGVVDPELRPAVAEAGRLAAGALEGFLAYLDELAAGAGGSYAIGEERYSALLVETELLDTGAGAVHRRGLEAYERISDELVEVAGRIDPASPWPDLARRLSQDHPATPEAMLDAYRAETARARAFLAASGLVTMNEGEECVVAPSPPFQRPLLAVASYSDPPAFGPTLRGVFFVPFPPEATPEPEVAQRLRTNSHHAIPTITAHEAYPGHHWHLTSLHDQPRPIRKVLGSSFFGEGWALYAEQLMREAGYFDDPGHLLGHLEARLLRAARMVVDTGLHTGTMGLEEAVRFLVDRVCLSEPTARAEVGRYCSWPTQAASYLTGALRIDEARHAYLRSGGGDLRTFNDRLARSGRLPVALAVRALVAGGA